jgi:predicted dehydrogenase
MINVAVVGLGFMGVTHIKSYRKVPNARLAAISDSVLIPEDGDFSKVAGNIGSQDPLKLDMTQVKAYPKYEDLLANPDIQLIDLCVPTDAHPSMTISALKAGKHVICEKPMARSSSLTREMASAAASASTYFMPAMCMRFWPEWAWLKQAITQNTYGRILAARFRRVSEAPGWSKDTYLKGTKSGGALLDLHIHDADFIQFCFGRPQSVYATGCSRLSGAIDHIVAQYRVANGAVVSAEGSWLMSPGHGFSMTYTAVFEKATADYDLARGADALRLFETGQSPRSVPCEGEDGYVGELRHIVDAIQAHQPPSVVTAKDGHSAVEICEAEELSIKLGQPVTL